MSLVRKRIVLPLIPTDIFQVIRPTQNKDAVLDLTYQQLLSALSDVFSEGGSLILLKTNGTDNPNQNILNLVAGTGVTLDVNDQGDVTINSFGGSFITSITDTATIDLDVTSGVLTGNLVNIGTAGTFGSGTQVPQVTIDNKGRVTNVQLVNITSGAGTVTSVGVNSGTGINATISGTSTINPTINITNTAPDVVVGIAGGATIGVSGTYPNFTLRTNVSTNNRLLGRYTAGAGAYEEILIGTNLTLSGNTLNATGGSGPGAVTSVFTRTGAVVAVSGDYNTSQVTESGSLYFTDARAIAAVLTGYVSGAGTISVSDSIVIAIGKLNGNIGALVTGVSSVNSLTGTVALTGTPNRLSISAANVFDIDTSYAGQNTITTIGTITTGTWNGTAIGTTYGGTGLTTIGAAFQLLRVNSSANGLEYFTPTYLTAAITSLNGLTNATQTFATPGTSGTAPNWNSVSPTHTLNIPLASTGSVTAGLISNADYTTFSGKQSALTATKSVEINSGNVELDGDLTSPGNNKVYGTDASGTRGWKADPTGGGNSIGQLTGDVDTVLATSSTQVMPSALNASYKAGSAGVIFDGAGGVIATNTVAYVRVPYKGTIIGWQIVANALGSCTIAVRQSTFGAFPPSGAAIVTPVLSGAQTSQAGSVLSIGVAAGDWLSFTISGVSTVAWVNLTLSITKIV